MKLKTRPEEFVVEEVASFSPDAGGTHYVYELQKRSLATLEALAMLARHNRLPAKALSAAGLKDKHGLTRQLFSASRPLKPDTGDERMTIRFVGKATHPLTAAVILGNRFRILMRNLRPETAQHLAINAAELLRHGLPNYYDNQRFGGIAHGQGFIGRALARGEYEEALRLHLAVPHRKQSLRDKQNRRQAQAYWGQWALLRDKMRPSPERALVDFLREHPGEWAECFDRIPPALRTLFVAAYQSYLFNRTLTRMVAEAVPGAELIQNRSGELAFHRVMEPDQLAVWQTLELPLLGANTNLADFPTAMPHACAVLAEEGISLDQLRLPGLRRTRFKAATRAALVIPQGLELSVPEPDDLNEGRLMAETSFELPRGSFATMVTRRLAMMPPRDH